MCERATAILARTRHCRGPPTSSPRKRGPMLSVFGRGCIIRAGRQQMGSRFRGNDVEIRGNDVEIRGNDVEIRGNDVEIRGNDGEFRDRSPG